MEKFNPPSQLTFDGNLREHWKLWKQELEFYMVATETDSKDDKVKSSILLTCIGPQGREVYNTLTFRTGENKLDYKLIIEKFEQYCVPRKNVTLVRHKFFTYKQREGQSFDEFTTQLKKLAADCEFEELKSSLIKDIIVVGVSDDRLRERMLREPKLTLKNAIQLGQSAEQTKLHSKELKQEMDISKINRATPNYANSNVTNINKCKYCGGSHRRGSCPAYKKTCNKCGKKGHFSSVCLSNKSLHYLENIEYEEEDDNSFIGAIFDEEQDDQTDTIFSKEHDDQSNGIDRVHTIDETNNNNEWSVSLLSNNTTVTYKIDSGAQVNVIPYKTFKKLHSKSKLLKSPVKLTAYNGSNIPVKGQCILRVQHIGKIIPLLFIVADIDSPPILGLRSSQKLNLIQRIMKITSSSEREHPNFLDEFHDCFGDIGTLPKIHHITVDKSVDLVVHSARSPNSATRSSKN